MDVEKLREVLSAAKSLGVKRIKFGNIDAEFFTESTEAETKQTPVQFNNEQLLSEEELLFWSSEAHSQTIAEEQK
jgi:hypothetical protein